MQNRNNNHHNNTKNKNNHSKYNNQLHTTMIYNILNERITAIKYMNAD